MPYYESMEDMIGKTPLLRLKRLYPDAHVFAKLECFNPTGSAKDRPALYMLNDYEARGILKPGGTVVEPTSGNTGVGLAAICAARGYHLILTMPDTMSAERRQLLAAYGARLVLTPGNKGMAGAVERAKRIVEETPGSVLAGQFTNPANPLAHESTTGPELWEALGGKLSAFVAGVGTGGTLAGAVRFLKPKLPALRVIAVEPAASPLLSEGRAGPHGIMGIGANFVPEILDRELIDEVISVTEGDARAMARALARKEGILAGISSGAALFAAGEVAKRASGPVAVVLPDGGERYLSIGLFEDEEDA